MMRAAARNRSRRACGIRSWRISGDGSVQFLPCPAAPQWNLGAADRPWRGRTQPPPYNLKPPKKIPEETAMAANPQAASKPATRVATVKLLIDGKFIESNAKQWRDIVNPATQEVVARVPMYYEAEVAKAVHSAAEAFKIWRNTPI